MEPVFLSAVILIPALIFNLYFFLFRRKKPDEFVLHSDPPLLLKKKKTLKREDVFEEWRVLYDFINSGGKDFIAKGDLEEFISIRLAQTGRKSVPGRLGKEVKVIRDVPYARTSDPRQTLDLYLPKRKNYSQPLPLIFYIHGGGWTAGNKVDGWSHLLQRCVSGEFAGISAGYRLAQEEKWPAQIHDCMAALRWAVYYGPSYGIDPSRICVMGHSAGAHLALLIGLGTGIRELEGKVGPLKGMSVQVSCILNFFGPTDLRLDWDNEKDGLEPWVEESFNFLCGGQWRNHPEIMEQASPVVYARKDAPPVLTLHGDHDPVVPCSQGKYIHEKLTEKGAESYYVPVKGAGHFFDHPDVNSKVRAFLEKNLLNCEELKVNTDPVDHASLPVVIPDRYSLMEFTGPWEYNRYIHPTEGASIVWTVPLKRSARYSVMIRYGDDPNNDHAHNAEYIITHAGGSTKVRVDLTRKTNLWVSIGTYRFEKDRAKVRLNASEADGVLVRHELKLRLKIF